MKPGSVGARTWLVYPVSALLVLSCLDTTQPKLQQPAPAGIVPPTGSARRPSVSAAMHLHGWSNHGASREPASIAWHTQQYAAAGVDILWWTDHSDSYAGRVPTFRVAPSTPVRINVTTWSIGSWGNPPTGRAFLSAPPGATAMTDSATGRVAVTLPPGDPTRRDTVELYFGVLNNGQIARAALTMLSRPLIGDPKFSLAVRRVTPAQAFPEVRVLVPLAWHPRGVTGYREVLRYRLAQGVDSSVTAQGDTLDYTLPLSGADSAVITLRPMLDATPYLDGFDNTTDEYRVRFVANEGSGPVSISFTLPTVVNGTTGASTQMPPAAQRASEMASAFGVRSIWGMEMAPATAELQGTRWEAVRGAGLHMAVYIPSGVPASIVDATGWTRGALTADVRSRGGLTSIAHPFGTQGGVPTSSFAENQALVDELGSLLVQYGAWGAQLIEVGYTSRGGVGITEHLELLDYLLASGIQICGIGTTDSHGGRMIPDAPPGSSEQWNFVTWIGGLTRLAPDTALINALRACNTSFGNPFYVRGGMWISLTTDGSGRPVVNLDVEGVSPSATFYLFEAEIDSTGTGHWPTYRARGLQIARDARPSVGGCRPGFARVEAWAGTRALAFSNVVLIPPDPSRC